MNTPTSFEDDATTCHRTSFLPSLGEVEAVLRAHPRVSVAYYDPGAGPRDPWLWLQDEDGKALRIVEAMGAEDVAAVARVWRPHLWLVRS